MQRVLKLAGAVGAACALATASPAGAATAQGIHGDGGRLSTGANAAGPCVPEAIRQRIRLDWCRSDGTGLGVRRAEDGGEWYDDHSDERGNGDAHGRQDLDGGRYADDHGGAGAGGERWERADWGDVRFRLSGTVRGRELSASQLESLLGRGVVSRLTRHAYEQRVDGALVGRWLRDDPRVLRVYGGRVPVAEFTDRDGDEKVDLLRLAYWR